MDQFTTIAPLPRQQRLLIAAMEFATSADYVTTLDKLCDLRDQGEIGVAVLVFAFRATAIRIGFLAYNYQNATVQTLVQRAKALVPDDPDFQDHLNDILNGSFKQRLEPYFLQEERPEPELLE